METTYLNIDIFYYLFYVLPISDKRSLIRTCKATYNFSIEMPAMEMEFRKIINETNYLHVYLEHNFYHPLCRYTIELIHDGRDVPDKYITADNVVLRKFYKIHARLARQGKLDVIQKIFAANSDENMIMCAKYAMMGAAEYGHLNILKWILKNGYPRDGRAMGYAAKGGQLTALKWMVKHNFTDRGLSFYYAAGTGNVEILQYLCEHKFTINDNYYAANKGKLEIIKNMYTMNPKSLYNVCEGAAKAGHLDVFIYAHERGETLRHYLHIHPVILSWLIENDQVGSQEILWCCNLESLKMLYEHGYFVPTQETFKIAISEKRIDIIKWLHEIDAPKPTTIGGYLFVSDTNIFNLLIEWGFSVSEQAVNIAAKNGKLEILQYLYTQHYLFNANTVSSAIMGKQLHVIVWLREIGVEWTEACCYAAAECNSSEMLRWLRGFDRDMYGIKSSERDLCPWDVRVCQAAIVNDNANMLDFALSNGCDYDDTSCGTMITPATHQRIRDCLTKHGK